MCENKARFEQATDKQRKKIYAILKNGNVFTDKSFSDWLNSLTKVNASRVIRVIEGSREPSNSSEHESNVEEINRGFREIWREAQRKKFQRKIDWASKPY